MLWHRRAIFWVAVLLFALLAVGAYFLFFAPSANSLLLPDLQYTSNYDFTKDPALEAQLVKDMNIPNGIANLSRKAGDFYDFGFSVKNEEGGNEVIAHMKSDGHFEVVWQGQDYPICAPIFKFNVPVDIVPRCYENKQVVDRSNFLRSFLTSLGLY